MIETNLYLKWQATYLSTNTALQNWEGVTLTKNHSLDSTDQLSRETEGKTVKLLTWSECSGELYIQKKRRDTLKLRTLT